jgi:hypothetical protein
MAVQAQKKPPGGGKVDIAAVAVAEKLDADNLGFKHKVTFYVLFCGEPQR